jgi:hypothetical protein
VKQGGGHARASGFSHSGHLAGHLGGDGSFDTRTFSNLGTLSPAAEQRDEKRRIHPGSIGHMGTLVQSRGSIDWAGADRQQASEAGWDDHAERGRRFH